MATTRGICAVEGCAAPVVRREWCSRHYQRWLRHGDPLGGRVDYAPAGSRVGALCIIDGCEKPVRSREWCLNHYMQWFKYGDPLADNRPVREACSVEGCEDLRVGRGLCMRHFDKNRRHGDPLGGRQGPPKRRYVSTKGYIILLMPEHPNATKRGMVSEHAVVMSEAIGRPLRPEETVHHRNGFRADNRLENLELWAFHHPPGQRVTDMVAFCQATLERYGALPVTNSCPHPYMSVH